MKHQITHLHCGDFTWSVLCLCEELSGRLLGGSDGVGFGGY